MNKARYFLAIFLLGFVLISLIYLYYPVPIELNDSGECPKFGVMRKIAAVGYFDGSKYYGRYGEDNNFNIFGFRFSSVPDGASSKLWAELEAEYEENKEKVKNRVVFPKTLSTGDKIIIIFDNNGNVILSSSISHKVKITGRVISGRECTVRVEKIEKL